MASASPNTPFRTCGGDQDHEAPDPWILSEEAASPLWDLVLADDFGDEDEEWDDEDLDEDDWEDEDDWDDDDDEEDDDDWDEDDEDDDDDDDEDDWSGEQDVDELEIRGEYRLDWN